MTDLFSCFFSQGAYFPKALFNTPEWQPDAEAMAALYRENPTNFIVEALRLACPVAGSHQVIYIDRYKHVYS